MPLAIFLDDGGVLSEDALRAPQWQRLVGAFCPPLLVGRRRPRQRRTSSLLFRFGTATKTAGSVIRRSTIVGALAESYGCGSCASMSGVPCPPDDAAGRLATRAHRWITRRVRAVGPGPVEAVRALAARGHPMHTASAEASDELDGYLRAVGVRSLFGRLYGTTSLVCGRRMPTTTRRSLRMPVCGRQKRWWWMIIQRVLRRPGRLAPAPFG